jgi:hypothetical protein
MKEKTTIMSSAAVAAMQQSICRGATGGWKRKSPGETGIKGSVGAWEMSGKREIKRKKNTKQNADGIVQ